MKKNTIEQARKRERERGAGGGGRGEGDRQTQIQTEREVGGHGRSKYEADTLRQTKHCQTPHFIRFALELVGTVSVHQNTGRNDKFDLQNAPHRCGTCKHST